jgi:hypothetical protein
MNICRPFSTLQTPGEAQSVQQLLPSSSDSSNLKTTSRILMRIAWNLPNMCLTSFGSCTGKPTEMTNWYVHFTLLHSIVFLKLTPNTENLGALSGCICGADPCCSLQCSQWHSQDPWDRPIRLGLHHSSKAHWCSHAFLLCYTCSFISPLNLNYLPCGNDQFEQGLTLVATGTLTIEMIRAAKGKTMPLLNTLNHSTGKISTHQTGFNNVTWGDSTCTYTKLITKAFNKKQDKLTDIITRAKEFFRKSHHTDGANTMPDSDADEEEKDLDDHALLVDISSSKSGSEGDASEYKVYYLLLCPTSHSNFVSLRNPHP